MLSDDFTNSEKPLGEHVTIRKNSFGLGGVEGNFNIKSIPGISLVKQLILVGTFASFLFGYGVGVINVSKSYILLDFDVCELKSLEYPVRDTLGCVSAKTYGSIINGVLFVAAFFGAVVTGEVLHKGRRFCLIVTNLCFLLGSILCAASNGVWMFLIGRLLVGFGVGAASLVVGVWVSEVSPRSQRGFFGVFIQLSIATGIFVAILLGLGFSTLDENEPYLYPVGDRVWWRVVVGLGSLPAVLSLLYFILLIDFDTPYSMVEQHDIGRGLAVFSKIHEQFPTDFVAEEFKNLVDAVKDSKQLCGKEPTLYECLMDSKRRRVLLIACILSMGQQLSGINVIITNSNLIYERTGMLYSIVTIMSILMGLLNVAMTFPPIFLTDKLGRKTLFLIGVGGQCIGLIPGMVASFVLRTDISSWFSLVSTYLYVVSHAIAYGPLLWVYLFEIFPLDMRKRGTALATSLNWLMASIVVLPSDYYLSVNPGFTFLTFSVICGLLCLFITFFILETKGRAVYDSPYFSETHDLAQKQVI